MATGELPLGGVAAPTAPTAASIAAPAKPLTALLETIASLKLTVTLFAASILLILFGTLAQVHYDVWYVLRESHFQVWFAWVEYRALLHLWSMLVPGDWVGRMVASQAGFYFPGGQLIGSLMLANLLAAHSIRFKANAQGKRLFGGLIVIALGVAAVVGVVWSGSSGTVKSDLPAGLASGLWHAMRASVAGVALAGLYWLGTAWGRVRTPEWLIGAGLVGLVAAGAVWLFLNPEARLDNAGLRIMWHLVKSTSASLVLLAGCILVFGRRAGMVVLHGGVGLLMIGEMLTGLMAQEARMLIDEGKTANYAVDIRTTELAFVDRSDPAEERVTVVPQHFFASAEPGAVIKHPELPVDLRVVRFYENSFLEFQEDEQADAGDNPATAGAGRIAVARPAVQVPGIKAQDVNRPSVYVEFLDKQSGGSAGVYLASIAASKDQAGLREQQVDLAGKTYGVSLRFKRLYKDYAVKLLDFQFNRYPGTNIAKDYRSEVQLLDPGRSVDRDVAIWMNNPLRYGGDTLYQADFDHITERGTVLQVVSNSSWLVPYVSCMVVGVGMLAHFGLTLGRFLRRRTEEADRRAKKSTGDATRLHWTSPLVVGPLLVGLVWAGYLGGKARPVKDAAGGMKIAELGALPLADGGRVKPFDSLARHTLQDLSARQEVLLGKEELPEDAGWWRQMTDKMRRGERLPAMQWLLDTVTARPKAFDYRVFRIENLEVLDLLKLERRPGSFRYSYNELMTDANGEEFDKQRSLLRGVDPDSYTIFQAKMSELLGKVSAYNSLANAFSPLRARSDPNKLFTDLQIGLDNAARAAQGPSPRAVPPGEAGGGWLTHYEAQLNDVFRQVPGVRNACVNSLGQFYASQPPFLAEQSRRALSDLLARLDSAGEAPANRPLGEALDAYANGKVLEFNRAVRELTEQFAEHETAVNAPEIADKLAPATAAERLSLARSRFEAFFSQFSPFYYCLVSYLVAFVLCAASWLVWPRALGRSATAILAATLLVHTFALVGRIYISGRPPITNLYGTAIFTSWAVTLAGLAIEAIYRMGVGNVLASVFGFLTLMAAQSMASDGDTFAVLQAVLDTQFWLATHVVCITLGYASTYIAGGIAILYLIRGHVLGSLDRDTEQAIPRMVYGTICFAIFFSFVGTVLGGLWGDNSWGRFWGWDPKENGAVIIVLWNALVLHARWGKMVGPTGLAALAVAGNICTTWSWFGTNELGVGLHAYSGLNDGISLGTMIIRSVAVTHPPLIAIALVPRETWRRWFGGGRPAESVA